MKPPAKGDGMMSDARFGDLAGAWELAWQTRFCPPETLLLSDQLAPETIAHLRACPFCAGLAAVTRRSGPSPRSHPMPDVKSGPRPPVPVPGQLWRLSPSLSGWGPKARYYNSPVVMVLKRGIQIAHAVLVAQTYHDHRLSGPGDVSLGPRRFAQPWNVYTIHSRDLERCCGQVEPDLVRAVLAQSQSPSGNLEATSVLHYFRQMEVELGCYFSSMAVISLLEEHQAMSDASIKVGTIAATAVGDAQSVASLAESLPAQTDLLADLLNLGLEIPESAVAGRAADLYFQAAPPVSELALAASGAENAPTVPVVAYAHHDGRPQAWHLLEAQVTDFVGSPQLMVGGRIGEPLPAGGPWTAEFRWLDREGRLVCCKSSQFTPSDAAPTRFWAVFPTEEPGATRPGNRLRIRLFREADKPS